MTEMFLNFLPEIILFLAGLTFTLRAVGVGGSRITFMSPALFWVFSICLLVTSIMFLRHPYTLNIEIFDGAFIQNSATLLLKIFLFIFLMISFAISHMYLKYYGLAQEEFSALICFLSLSLSLLLSINSLMSLYLCLELQTLVFCILLALNKTQSKTLEGALKFFCLSAVASAFLLYGISLIYGFTGSVKFLEISRGLLNFFSENTQLNTLNFLSIISGLGLLIIGLSFKLAAAPFYMWAPDVYEGAPLPVTVFLSAAPKIVIIMVLAHLLVIPFSLTYEYWSMALKILAALSLIVGTLGALEQESPKRLLAYSAVGNIGYVLIGIAAAGTGGVQSAILYGLLYIVTLLGIFACLVPLDQHQEINKLSDLKGLNESNPLAAFCLAVLLLSLVGIPPLAGFFAKFYIFIAAVEAEMYGVVIIAILTSIAAAYYCLRIMKYIYFEKPEREFELRKSSLCLLLFLTSIVVGFVIFQNKVLEVFNQSLASFFVT